MRLDLAVRGGTVATEAGAFRADVGVRDGRIVALAEALDAEDVIDATGQLVLPGGIETHCHIAQESATGLMTADDYRTGSISAAFGGNTCIIPFAAQHRGMGVTETLDLYERRAAGASVLDYGHHLIVADPTETALRDELPAAFARGVTALKVFMTYDRLRIEDARFLDLLALAARHDAIVMVHAENHGMIQWMSARLEAAGRRAPRFHASSHPALAEEEAIHRAICLAKLADARLMIVHVSTPEGAALAARARAEGARVHAETCPHYLAFTREALDRPGMEGAKFMCSPPLRDAAAQAALWDHLRRGDFDVVSSDHAPYRFDASGKLAHGEDAGFRRIANGLPGIGARLPWLFSEGVVKRRITLSRFVALSAGQAARLYGLDHVKGAIRIGADADLALWDPQEEWTLRLEDQHDAMDYTPYEGMRLTGRPRTTLSRGRRVVEDCRLVGRPGFGRFVPRRPPALDDQPGSLGAELDPADEAAAAPAPARDPRTR